jgi:3-hydroxybutyryl-CoA dehydrogenase
LKLSTKTSTGKSGKKSAGVLLRPEATPVGVVGVGVMGAVITSCLLAAGHPVAAVSLDDVERRSIKARVRKHLKSLHQAGRLESTPEDVMRRLQIHAEYSALANCALVVESIIENLDAKHTVLRNVEAVVSARALIGSNTSALPNTKIQSVARNPKRVLGLHWVSSSPFSWCVEIMGGEQTARAATRRAGEFVKLWGKTPALSRRDKPGFICNRIGYALLREACALLDEGVATADEIDQAVRASLGTWLPFVGPFGYLDLSGLTAYAPVMRDLLPDLSDNDAVPASLEKLQQSGAEGIANGRGFYRYKGTDGEKKRQDFDEFRHELVQLIERYEK